MDASTAAAETGGDTEDALARARDTISCIERRAKASVVGRDDVIELTLIALLADGHVLLEDYPGSGKTTLARCLGESLSGGTDAGAGAMTIAPFRRIQFTPDLLPSDVTGTSVFELDTNRFSFRPGPIFAHIVLADEINRTSPKVQAAMLEAMAEKQVTVDNDTHALDALFFVIATQNPLDVAGTYPLPTPQLDRFLFKITMRHIARDAELDVLRQYPTASLDMGAELPRITRDQLLSARTAVRAGVHIAEPIREALVDLARSLREDERVLQGASTRSRVLMLPALQARALLRGRDFVAPEDVEALAVPVFGHRIECVPGVGSEAEVIAAALAPQIERLAKLSLQR
ncbi:MAG: MoxR family ATPase [Myxococcales bacterium]|nr:MoxR family ATPase [Myxococcales bacterium]